MKGKVMKKTILEVYARLVCLFAVIVITISSSILIHSVVGVAQPELTMSNSIYDKHLNNEKFKSRNATLRKDAKNRTDEEITARRESAFAQELRKERRKNAQTILHSAIFVFVSSVVLLIHWKIARKSREATA